MKWTRTAMFACLAIAGACSSGGGANLGSSRIVGSSGGSGEGDDGATAASSGGSSSNGAGSGLSGQSSGNSGGTSSGNGTSDATTTGEDAAEAASSEVAGCGTTKLLQVPDDTSAAGPWPVGVKTVQVTMTGGSRPVEVWYPASLGSAAGQTQVTYNVEDYLPPGQATKIPASANKVAECNCYRDLPIDSTHGPYPAVIFLHGTGSFRTASLSTMVQWASRGFIAVAADHAGLFLTDFLVTASLGGCTGGTGVAYGQENLSADVDAMIAGLNDNTGAFSFLGSNVDMSRIGISGHSQGASDAASYGNKPNVEVDMPLADLGGTVVPSTSALKSVLVAAGMSDSVVPYSSDQSAYSGSPSPKRLVGITGGDHLDVTDLCWETNSSGQTAIQVASQYGICGASLLAALAKCGNLSPPTVGPKIVNYVTTAALEETLHCTNRDAAFSALLSKFSQVGDFDHTP
jgi:predicted dienelactone hydrolase